MMFSHELTSLNSCLWLQSKTGPAGEKGSCCAVDRADFTACTRQHELDRTDREPICSKIPVPSSLIGNQRRRVCLTFLRLLPHLRSSLSRRKRASRKQPLNPIAFPCPILTILIGVEQKHHAAQWATYIPELFLSSQELRRSGEKSAQNVLPSPWHASTICPMCERFSSRQYK